MRAAIGLAGLLCPLVAACASYVPEEYRFTPESEAELGGPLVEVVERELPIVTDPAILAPVGDLGRGLVAALGSERRAFAFRVVDRPTVNAFSLPGGFVYVHRGLLETTKNMSEVAGVLSHEIAHVVAGHSAERLLHSRRTRLGLTVSAPGSDRSASLFYAHYHRVDEAEADSLAVEIMVGAGWDPAGLVSFFQSMLWLREHRRDFVGGPFLSHPTLEQRIAAVRRLLDRIPDERRRGLRQFTLEYGALRDALDAARPPRDGRRGS